jgi:hypothetical protein
MPAAKGMASKIIAYPVIKPPTVVGSPAMTFHSSVGFKMIFLARATIDIDLSLWKYVSWQNKP